MVAAPICRLTLRRCKVEGLGKNLRDCWRVAMSSLTVTVEVDDSLLSAGR